MIGDSRRRPGRLGRGGILLGEGDECLAADPQVLDLLAEFAQTRGQSVDLRLGLLGLAGQDPLAGVDLVQEPGAGVEVGPSSVGPVMPTAMTGRGRGRRSLPPTGGRGW